MKKVLIGFLAIVFLLFASIIVFVLTFNVNSYKSKIEQVLFTKTGYEFNITGTMKVTRSLVPTLTVDGIEIKAPNAFAGAKPLLVAKNVQITFDLKAWLKEVVIINSIELSDVSIALQVDEKGKNNWTGGKNALTDKKNARPSLKKALPVQGGKLQVDTVLFKNAQVHYENKQQHIDKLLQVPQWQVEKLVNFDGQISYQGEVFNLSGSVRNLLNVLATKRNLNFSAEFKALDSTGSISGVCRDLQNCANDVTLNLSSKGQDLKRFYEFLLGKNDIVPSLPYEQQVAIKLSKKQLLAEGQASLQDAQASLSYNIERHLVKGNGKGHLTLEVNKAELLAPYGLQPFSLQTSYSVEKFKKYHFSNIVLMFNETDVDGQLSLDLSNPETALIDGALHSHYLKWSDVFSSQLRGQLFADSSTTDQTNKLFSPRTFAMRWLDKIEGNLLLDVNNWASNNMFLRSPSLSLNISQARKVLTIELNEGSLIAAGQVVGRLTLDRAQAKPRWSLNFVGENLQINQINALKKNFQNGQMEANVFLTATGDSFAQIASTMNGNVSLLFNQWEIFSPIVAQIISQSGQVKSHYGPSQDLFVKCGVLSANIKDGIMQINPKTAFETNRFNMLLDGDINLRQEQVNVHLIPQSVRSNGEKQIQTVIVNGAFDNLTTRVEKVSPAGNEQDQAAVGEKKDILEAYVIKKAALEDVSLCRVALSDLPFKTINDYFGRVQKREVSQVQEAPKQEEPKTKAQQFGEQFLHSLSGALAQ